MFELRQYQDKAINDLRLSFAAGNRRILLVAPTGAGKTVIAAQIVRGAVEKERYVMFLAHRRELVNQSADKLMNFGVDHAVLMSGELPYGATDVQVASIDTLRARCINSDKLPLPRADVIVIDEAHRSLAPTYLKVIELYPEAVVLGLTATPIRSDGKGMGHVYEDMVQCPSIAELTRLKHLVPARVFCPTIPDLTGVKVTRGDYDKTALEKAMNKRKLVGDVVEQWLRLASDRKTIVFASGVAHSIALKEAFEEAGVKAAHVDGTTNRRDRDWVIRDLKNGGIQVVCNFGVFTEGFDEPSLSCNVIARPTKNDGLFLQMGGRVLRTCDGKKDAIILDHSGNTYQHGFLADERHWVLEVGRGLADTPKERKKKLAEKEPIVCVKCSHMYTGQLICPACGHLPKKKGKQIESRAGDLFEVKERKSPKKRYTQEQKQLWYSCLLHMARAEGKKEGWAAYVFKEKFGEFPRQLVKITTEPTQEIKRYVKYRNIKYHRGQEAKKKREAEHARR